MLIANIIPLKIILVLRELPKHTSSKTPSPKTTTKRKRHSPRPENVAFDKTGMLEEVKNIKEGETVFQPGVLILLFINTKYLQIKYRKIPITSSGLLIGHVVIYKVNGSC